MRYIDDALVRSSLGAGRACDIVRQALALHAGGGTGLTSPPTTFLPVSAHDRLQVKGAYIDGVAGFRLAGERDFRYVDEGRLMVCYRLSDLLPIAVIEEQGLYRLRVAAQLAVAIDRFRPAAASALAVIGAGRLVRATLEVVQAVTMFEQVRVYSRRPRSRDALVADLGDRLPGDLRAVQSVDEACGDADVVLTLTTAQHPVLTSAAWRPGRLIVSAGGGWECAADLYTAADRLVVDDWDQCLRMGDLVHLASKGAVHREDVSTTLPDAVVDESVERCGPTERVVAAIQGMAVLDVALGAAVAAMPEPVERTREPEASSVQREG